MSRSKQCGVSPNLVTTICSFSKNKGRTRRAMVYALLVDGVLRVVVAVIDTYTFIEESDVCWKVDLASATTLSRLGCVALDGQRVIMYCLIASSLENLRSINCGISLRRNTVAGLKASCRVLYHGSTRRTC